MSSNTDSPANLTDTDLDRDVDLLIAELTARRGQQAIADLHAAIQRRFG